MKNQKQEQARDLYLQSDLTQTQIADILSIDRKTLYLWIRNNHWDKIKVAARQAPAIVQQDIYNHISSINCKIYSRDDRMPTLQEVEMLRKLFGMVKTMNSIHVGGYIQSFQDLCTFISELDPAIGREVKEHAHTYITTVLKDEFRAFHTETMYEVIERIKQEENIEELPLAEQPHQGLQDVNEAPDSSSVDSMGNDGKLENNDITPPEPNTGAPQQNIDNKTNDEKFPNTDLDSDGENSNEDAPGEPPADNT